MIVCRAAEQHRPHFRRSSLMTILNRAVAILLWLILLVVVCSLAIAPVYTINLAQNGLAALSDLVETWRTQNPENFAIGQWAIVAAAVAIFGLLLWLEILALRRRGVRVRTAQGGSVEVETNSIGRRLEWHLDQLAEIITVVPVVRSKGGSVDIKLEIEAAPDIDVPMKTDEVVDVTRDIIEQDLGLKLGKLDVHMRCAPFEPEWN